MPESRFARQSAENMRFFSEHAVGVALHNNTYFPAILLQTIEEHLSTLHPPVRLLDAGCGYGQSYETLCQFGVDYVGIDVAPGQIELAREAHPEGEFHVASLAHAHDHVRNGRLFDFFLCREVIPFIPTPFVVPQLRGLRKAIRLGGIGIFTIFVDATQREQELTYKEHDAIPKGYTVSSFAWTKENFLRCLPECGFEGISSRSTSEHTELVVVSAI